MHPNYKNHKQTEEMRRRTVLKTFKFMAAGVTVAMGVTPAYSLPTNESISAPADTTRVIDIEEVLSLIHI